MKNFELTLNGKNLADYGVIVSGTGAFDGAERDYEIVEIPGRASSLRVDRGRWLDVTMEYECLVSGQDNVDAVRAFLTSISTEEIRIEDSFHPDEYYLGYIEGAFEPKMKRVLKDATFTIEIDRRPERYLKSGEKEISTVAANPVPMFNPTLFNAYPKIKIVTEDCSDLWTYKLSNGTGFTIQNVPSQYGVSHTGEFWLLIDCDEMTARYVDTNGLFTGIRWLNDERAYIAPGFIQMDSASNSTTVTPRWFTM